MRKLLLVAWLTVPVVGAAYHYGPGQQRLLLDDIAGTLAEADRLAAAGDWSAAEQKYEESLNRLPPEMVREGRRIRLERAKAQMLASKLPTAHQDLKDLVAELDEDKHADPQVLAEARTALANSQYYMTWLMRLEGEPKEKWEPEIEAARQTLRLLAEHAERDGNPDAAQQCREDLESSIRLARMELTDLQGLPLPSQ